MGLFNRLTALLPAKAQPFAKALYPAIAAIVAVFVSAVSTGALNTSELKAGVGGLAMAALTFLIPNTKRA